MHILLMVHSANSVIAKSTLPYTRKPSLAVFHVISRYWRKRILIYFVSTMMGNKILTVHIG